ncbi:MAG TPA: biopolymer transporter ExbD [Chitinophagaceae bacterium]|nr:biopolymer transporter ExbD [Chitinophagaceae bacterium]
MPSVKIPKKAADTDMTPFVDIAFLILTFFIMATKMKPPEPVEITTPYSVSSKELEQKDALMIQMDKDGRVFFTMNTEKPADNDLKYTLIKNLNQTRNLGLTEGEMRSFVKDPTVGVPFNKLKPYLATPEDRRKNVRQEGIPVTDSASNELYYWVRDAISVFSGRQINYMVKGDNNSKYPVFKGVIDALRRNDQNKYKLITSPEAVPMGTDLFRTRNTAADAAAE